MVDISMDCSNNSNLTMSLICVEYWKIASFNYYIEKRYYILYLWIFVSELKVFLCSGEFVPCSVMINISWSQHRTGKVWLKNIKGKCRFIAAYYWFLPFNFYYIHPLVVKVLRLQIGWSIGIMLSMSTSWVNNVPQLHLIWCMST